ncbi:hypothetical protein VNO77_04489 [Canavalia gladiata]|uniref:Uncharacterized protein n=1 Tax=Canavalia gladiata TaxID=3824 RepID=A0AAN9N347_CANGL
MCYTPNISANDHSHRLHALRWQHLDNLVPIQIWTHSYLLRNDAAGLVCTRESGILHGYSSPRLGQLHWALVGSTHANRWLGPICVVSYALGWQETKLSLQIMIPGHASSGWVLGLSRPPILLIAF